MAIFCEQCIAGARAHNDSRWRDRHLWRTHGRRYGREPNRSVAKGPPFRSAEAAIDSVSGLAVGLWSLLASQL